MNVHPSVTDIDKFDAPWGRKVTLQKVTYDGGMALLRIRIQENQRFTDLELDPETATQIGRILTSWAAANAPPAT